MIGQTLDELGRQGVVRRVFPGAAWAAGDRGGPTVVGTAGVLDPADPDQPVTAGSLFDIASLTKVVAVWSAVGLLVGDGSLAVNQPLSAVFEETKGSDTGRVTIRQLLTHTAGLPARARLKELYGADPAKIREGVLTAPLEAKPGSAVVYTDRAALVLGFVVEQVAGQSLGRFCDRRVWRPLGMPNTRFGPLSPPEAGRTAATELDDSGAFRLRGIAHDFSARLLGGECGVAGLFSDVADLGTFARAVLGGDEVIPHDWSRQSLRVQTQELRPARGFFWHPYEEGPLWCHLGFTGTAIWLSPATGRWAVLLTNKICYTRDRGPIAEFRRLFAEAAFGLPGGQQR